MRARISTAVLLIFLICCQTVSAALPFLDDPIPVKAEHLVGPTVTVGKLTTQLSSQTTKLFDHAPNPLALYASADGTTLSANVGLIGADDLKQLSATQKANLAKPNSYIVDITQKGIQIVGSDANGAIYGVDHVYSLLKKGGGQLKSGQILNWPDNETRALHIVIRGVSPQKLRELIDRAREARLNTLIIQLGDYVQFESRAISPRRNAISKTQLQEIVAYARANGLMVIPEVTLLTHQKKLFKNNFPDLMYNKKTYDPANAKVYELVFEFLDEVIDTLQPRAIHIGHDEVVGIRPTKNKQPLKNGETALPAELFLQDVITLRDYLHDRDIETWMWGDMLISPDEFPDMHPADINGVKGYHKIRTKIPRDVVICDWHYYQKRGDFSSTAQFAREGFGVLGASWKRNKNIKHYSRFMAEMEPPGRGMIATTWFHIPDGDWELVDEIIDVSGRNFWQSAD